MDPLVKRLLVIGIVGLIVTWGTFLALEFAPEDEEAEPVADEPPAERRAASISLNKKQEERRARIAAAKRRRLAQNPPTIRQPVVNRPPVVNQPEPPPAPQQTAAIKAPMVPDLPPKIPPSTNPANTMQLRFGEMEKVYELETRDSVWADEKEKRILDVFKKGDYEETLVDISCRKTLCRMEVRLDSTEALVRLFGLPGLAAEVGLNGATQPVGEGDDRRMISFLTRKQASE